MAEKGRGGNRGFGDMLADGYDNGSPATPPARPALPTDSVLTSRSTTLGDLATGKMVTERTMWVDPARCRPWVHHNRDQTLLDEASCHDLITSFQAEGTQRLPAIVRRLRDDPDHDFEIIAGVRRHWTVAYLNSHNYPDFEFLITVKALTDEEAFRLADVENRARQDLTDLERAHDYAKALDLFYAGRQTDMAARLHVPPAWLSRLLELARMPAVILDCFADRREIRVEHAKQLAPVLKDAPKAKRLLAAAGDLARQQRSGDATVLRPAEVVRFLLRAAEEAPKRARPAAQVVMSATNRPMVRAAKRGRGLQLDVIAGSGASRADLLAAIAAILGEFPEARPFG
ncbi:MAG: ParB/RepB/Spo0J family partition protein [Janthinobacterium lividum]